MSNVATQLRHRVVFAPEDKALWCGGGRGGLIEGWEEALQKMHKGEKWLLIVPPEMAYGARGKPPTIKRNATLVFEMELVDCAK